MVTMPGIDYQSMALFGGFYELLGMEQFSSYFGPRLNLFPHLYRPHPKGDRIFSIHNVYQTDVWNVTLQNEILQQRLQTGFFNVIVITNGQNMYCDMWKYFFYEMDKVTTFVDYQMKYNPLVITVDGNDGNGCHAFFTSDGGNKTQYHVHFAREFHKVPRSQVTPAYWSGCEM
jgi:hypothetical protein